MIARMGKTRFIVCAALILVLCAAIVVAAIGLKLPKATGIADSGHECPDPSYNQ